MGQGMVGRRGGGAGGAGAMPGELLRVLLRAGCKVRRRTNAAWASLDPPRRGAAAGGMATLIKKIINTTKAPAAVGPYSQAVLVDRTMYIAGQIGMDPSNGQLVPGGVKEQTKQALKNMGEILKAADCDYGNVVKTTVLMADMKDFDDMNEVYRQFFKGDFPARAAYQVAALPKGARVEIEGVAISGPLCDAKHDIKGSL